MPNRLTSVQAKRIEEERQRELHGWIWPGERRMQYIRDVAVFLLQRDGLREWEVYESKIRNRAGDCDAEHKQLRLSRVFFLSQDRVAIRNALAALIRAAKTAEGHSEEMQRINSFARNYVAHSLGCCWRFEFGVPWVDGGINGWNGYTQEVRIDPSWARTLTYAEIRKEVFELVDSVRRAQSEVAA
jgi:hypothetical protein